MGKIYKYLRVIGIICNQTAGAVRPSQKPEIDRSEQLVQRDVGIPSGEPEGCSELREREAEAPCDVCKPSLEAKPPVADRLGPRTMAASLLFCWLFSPASPATAQVLILSQAFRKQTRCNACQASSAQLMTLKGYISRRGVMRVKRQRGRWQVSSASVT